MVTVNRFRKIALNFPEAVELPHFEKTSFRVNKKIFATLDVLAGTATVKLDENNQDLFARYHGNCVTPVPNKWGKQGWTIINLEWITEEMLMDILQIVFCEVAPKRLQNGIVRLK